MLLSGGFLATSTWDDSQKLTEETAQSKPIETKQEQSYDIFQTVVSSSSLSCPDYIMRQPDNDRI